ncbi:MULTISPECIES: hemerythrin domain-containing protein [Legionella]|uniref:Hemerythrin n=1 Tax=Legionella quinlivanii TaxID=45073 RepID=A0A364LHQ4_9GAMM|nr:MULTISPECIES: hemerythrin domain-containing protein [Legionella]MCE3044367.1 hemerythrin domain-containing protein [Legionella sp. 16cNR16C]RAP35886.1 hemerythrin [Legionella quinlivanii]
MNAIDFLIREHERVKQRFIDISDESHREETRKKMFNELCMELIRHEKMEHKVWYPHFKNDDRLDDTVRHLLTEEKHAEQAIRQFDDIKTEAAWERKFNKLMDDVIHHAEEEEQKLFPKVRKLLSEEELEQIGKDMSQFKRQYSKDLH